MQVTKPSVGNTAKSGTLPYSHNYFNVLCEGNTTQTYTLKVRFAKSRTFVDFEGGEDFPSNKATPFYLPGVSEFKAVSSDGEAFELSIASDQQR